MHDNFERNPICPTTLVVQVWVPDEAISLAIQVPPATEQYSSIIWTGVTRRYIDNLEPRKLAEIELQLGVTAYGWHTISGVTVSWGRPGSDAHDSSRSLPGYLVNVVPSSSM